MCYSIELRCSYRNDRRQVIDVNSVDCIQTTHNYVNWLCKKRSKLRWRSSTALVADVRHTSVTSVFRSTRLLDVHAYVQLTTVIWLSHVYRHSATVLVAFAFQGPPSGTHSHKNYEAVTFPGNSSSVDLRHGCLSVLMCRWRVWEFLLKTHYVNSLFDWLIDWLIDKDNDILCLRSGRIFSYYFNKIYCLLLSVPVKEFWQEA